MHQFGDIAVSLVVAGTKVMFLNDDILNSVHPRL